MTDLETPLTKEPGALKDAHEAELGGKRRRELARHRLRAE
jgi:hypothetical protein